MTESIMERLQNSEVEFLHAIPAGVSAINDFGASWLHLQQEIDSAHRTSVLNQDILSLAGTTARRMVLLADLFLQQQMDSERLTDKLADELDGLFAGMTLSDPIDSPPLTDTPPDIPAYIEPSYRWLTQNLHNPYPTPYVRDQISSTTGCSRQDIDSWFIDTRRRIGWTKLRKERFSNKRSDIVDAATRFFIEADPKRPLTPGIDVAFADILSAVSGLYSKLFSETGFAMQLGSIVMAPVLKSKARGQKRPLKSKPGAPMASYHPSNEHPPASIPNSATQPTPRRKRSRSPCCDEDRTEKRSRCDRQLLQATDEASLKISPAAQSSRLGDLSTATFTLPVAPMKRKRRLSESDVCFGPKRPCDVSAGPRATVVSNPLPIPIEAAATAVDEWLKHGSLGLDIPNDIIDELDLTEPLDITLFDFSTLLATGVHPPDSDSSANSTPTTLEQFLPTEITPLQIVKNADTIGPPSSLTSETSIDDAGYLNHAFISPSFVQDDMNYSLMTPCLPLDLVPQTDSLTPYNSFQHEFTAGSLIPWDWFAQDVSHMNTLQQSSGIFSNMFQDVV